MAINLCISNERGVYLLTLVNTLPEPISNVCTSYHGFMSVKEMVDTIGPQWIDSGTVRSDDFTIIDEVNEYDFDFMMTYTILFVKDSKVYIQTYENNKLRNVINNDCLPIVQKPGWMLPLESEEKMDSERISEEVFRHAYETNPPIDSSSYDTLINEYPPLLVLFSRIYREINSYYRGVNRNSEQMEKLAAYLRNERKLQLEHSEGTEILLAYCATLKDIFRYSNKKIGDLVYKYTVGRRHDA